jgi:transcriptional regulator with XRE-family HTH domain
MKTFGELLSECMEERGIGQNELSRLSGVSAPYISQLRSGKIADPTFLKACALIEALGMTPNEFAEAQDA